LPAIQNFNYTNHMKKEKKDKLTIAIVTNNYTPYSGGVVSSINTFVDELHKKGHKAFIITLDFLGKEHSDPYYVIRIPSITRFLYKKNIMAIPWGPTKKLMDIIKILKPDIIHTQHPFFLGKSALTVARKLDIPIVFTYHTIYEQYAHYVPTPEIISRPIIKKIVLAFCKKVDGIICPSNYIKHFLHAKNIQTKIEKIPSGILPLFIKPKNTNPQKGFFNLLTVSRFVKEKNIPFLLKLFAKLYHTNATKQHLPQFTFTLIGYGAEYEKLKKYAYKKLKIPQDTLEFICQPNKTTISDTYYQSDLFLFSSTTDTQGLVLAEAMAGGCPIVAIDGPGQRDIVVDGFNGFLCQSEDQMIEKIISIAKNKELHDGLTDNALQTGRQYHPALMTQRLIKLYHDVLEQQGHLR